MIKTELQPHQTIQVRKLMKEVVYQIRIWLSKLKMASVTLMQQISLLMTQLSKVTMIIKGPQKMDQQLFHLRFIQDKCNYQASKKVRTQGHLTVHDLWSCIIV